MNNSKKLKVIIIGAGMSGILAAIKSRQLGHDVVVYEKADKIGGTWRENTYPGLTCDTPAHTYSYSFERNPEWSQYLSPGSEIQEYFERVVDKYNVEPLIHFGAEIDRCEYVPGGWKIYLKDGSVDTGDVLIAATGVLHHPNIPEFKGADDFKGALFHTARWDHSVPLDGKRVGVIGNGSTGVQIISALAGRAEVVKHFQRTAQWIMPVENPVFTEEEKALFRADPAEIEKHMTRPEYLEFFELFTDSIVDAQSEGMARIEDIVLQNLENSVQDSVLKEKLRPNYRAACKRMVFSTNYYEAIQHPQAELITDDIDCIEPNGIRTKDGALHELDVIALATGFRSDRFLRPMQVQGRNGVVLDEFWEKRPTAYLAVTLPDFPNLFMLNGPTGPVGNFSLVEAAEMQWGYIEQLLEKLSSGQCSEICVSENAMADYEKRRLEAAKNTIFASGCKSWYLDKDGVPVTWPWGYRKFVDSMATPIWEHFQTV